MKKQKNFLGSRTFAPGEYEAQQATFDGAIDAFSKALMEPVGRSLRLQLAQHGVEALDDIRKTLDALIVDGFGHEAKEEAADAIATQLLEDLQRTPSLDEEIIAQEVRTCSREIAERVLARWLERLNKALRTQKSLALNANLLPGEQSVDEMLEHINFEADGINRLVVVNGLRTYWAELTKVSLDTAKPIELGRHVWIVPLQDDQSYSLFKDRTEAEDCMKAAQSTPVPASAPQSQKERYLARYRFLLGVLSPDAPRLDNLALALFRMRVSTRKNAASTLVQWSDAAIARALFGEGGGPELDLMTSVEAGVDYIAAGGEERARSVLISPKISQHLSAYAAARGLSLHAVHNAYALAVCVGVECQPMRYDANDLSMGAPDNFDAYRRFADAHHMNPKAARRLVSAVFAGTAFSTPGVALPQFAQSGI